MQLLLRVFYSLLKESLGTEIGRRRNSWEIKLSGESWWGWLEKVEYFVQP
jgi:hypothetical protein